MLAHIKVVIARSTKTIPSDLIYTQYDTHSSVWTVAIGIAIEFVSYENSLLFI